MNKLGYSKNEGLIMDSFPTCRYLYPYQGQRNCRKDLLSGLCASVRPRVYNEKINAAGF